MSRKKKIDYTLEYYLADYFEAAMGQKWQSQYREIFKRNITEWSQCQSRNKLDRRK